MIGVDGLAGTGCGRGAPRFGSGACLATTPANAPRSLGPPFSGLDGRPSASAGFNYSDANKIPHHLNEATFKEYIKIRCSGVPGTRMASRASRISRRSTTSGRISQFDRRQKKCKGRATTPLLSAVAVAELAVRPALLPHRVRSARVMAEDVVVKPAVIRDFRPTTPPRWRPPSGRMSPASASSGPVIPGDMLGGIPTDLIEVQRGRTARPPRRRSAGSRPPPKAGLGEPARRRRERGRRAPTCSVTRGASISPSSGRPAPVGFRRIAGRRRV